MGNPLEGIIVVDLTRVLAGPFSSLVLTDLGATVIKVEVPGRGDDTRSFPPFKQGESAYFAAINHGKKSIALDLKNPEDRVIFEKLLEKADILLENYRPGVMERLGYGYEDLKEKHPSLIYTSISGFGHSGPDMMKPAYDMVAQARGGVMSITGEKDRDPVRVGASVGDIVAGLFATQGILAALYARKSDGKGQKIDIAMLDSQLAILEHAVAITTVTGTPPGRTGARHPSITPFETYMAQDGQMVIAAGNDSLFEGLCKALKLGPLHKDSRFITNEERCKNPRILKRLIETVTVEKPISFWIEILDAEGIPCAPIQNVSQVLEDPQIHARNMLVDILPRTEGAPSFRSAGNPIKMSNMEDPTTRPPVPALDGNRQEILEWIGMENSSTPKEATS